MKCFALIFGLFMLGACTSVEPTTSEKERTETLDSISAPVNQSLFEYASEEFGDRYTVTNLESLKDVNYFRRFYDLLESESDIRFQYDSAYHIAIQLENDSSFIQANAIYFKLSKSISKKERQGQFQTKAPIFYHLAINDRKALLILVNQPKNESEPIDKVVKFLIKRL